MEKAYNDITFERTPSLKPFRPVLRRFKGYLKAYMKRDKASIYLDICNSDDILCSYCRPAETLASEGIGYCNFLASYGPDGLNTTELDACPCRKELRDWLKGL